MNKVKQRISLTHSGNSGKYKKRLKINPFPHTINGVSVENKLTMEKGLIVPIRITAEKMQKKTEGMTSTRKGQKSTFLTIHNI